MSVFKISVLYWAPSEGSLFDGLFPTLFSFFSIVVCLWSQCHCFFLQVLVHANWEPGINVQKASAVGNFVWSWFWYLIFVICVFVFCRISINPFFIVVWLVFCDLLTVMAVPESLTMAILSIFYFYFKMYVFCKNFNFWYFSSSELFKFSYK